MPDLLSHLGGGEMPGLLCQGLLYFWQAFEELWPVTV